MKSEQANIYKGALMGNWTVKSKAVWRMVYSILCILTLCASAGPLGSVTSFVKNGQTVRFTMQNGTMNVTVCTPKTIRVWAVLGSTFIAKDAYGASNFSWAASEYTTSETANDVVITTAALVVTVSKSSGAISYRDQSSSTLCAESPTTVKDLTAITKYSNAPYSFTTNFLIASDESIYGFGHYPLTDKKLDWKGSNSELYPARYTTSGDLLTIPVAISNRGYGIFWDNILNTLSWQQSNSIMSVKATYAPFLDYYFMYGPQIDTIIKAYRDISGKPPMFGKWVMGFHQSKCAYNSQAEVLSIAKEFRNRKIPIDNIITDWNWWTDWGTFQFKPAQWPNPTAMNDSLHNGLHCHSQLSIWTVFNPGNPNYDELNGAGCLGAGGFPNGNAKYNNVFMTKCDSIYWKQVSQQIWTKKFDAIWNDATEGDMYANIDWRSPAYALMVCKTSYEGQRAITNDKRVYTLTRSAWAGQQRYGFTLWSGDIQTDFAELKRQIPAGLNYCMSGMPYWCTDIGGYWKQTDAETMTRWFEFGTFCPVFRVHGSADKEPWRYGAAAEKTMTDYIKLRYRLMPYIYSLAWKVTSEGYTMMRGLLMDFKNDVTARNSVNQFMFGPALLVNPVTDAAVTSRQVYLPAGKWIDFWTGSATNGGATVTAAAPLQTIPMYVPAGSILPMGPDLQYATEKPADTIELRVYPGADGSFTLYEDENDNYNYEKGQYATIPITWNDVAQTLTIGARQGTFPGMLDKRMFNVVVVSPNHGSGGGFTATPDARVAYDGTPLSVKNGQITGASRVESNQLIHFAGITHKELRIVASNDDAWKVRVFDLRGRVVFSMVEKGPKSILLQGLLSNGMYMLSIQFLNDNTMMRQKIVVQ
jgi:alpha-D-xyloside xylohydrolase